MLPEYVELFMDYLRVLKLDVEPIFLPQWAAIRDALVQMVYNQGGDDRVNQALRLAKKFRAEQVFIKIVFENGSTFYSQLHDQISIWGDSFLLLALRVVYILEKRRLQNCVKENARYQGFEMFTIFEEQHYTALEDFLGQKNQNMLILLQARNAGRQ